MSADKARGFLEDIVEHPDDDTPRLIFADWLEEEGGDAARAEFIRVQIQRTRLPGWEADQVRLRLRESELITKHVARWKKDLPKIPGVTWGGFRRGFIATAAFASFAVLRENAAACWAAAPLEGVSLRWPRRGEEIDNIAPIAGLRELSIRARLVDPREVSRLADWPLLATLRVLTVSESSLGADGFRRLLASPHLGNLTALRVPCNSIGTSGVSALFNAATLKSLSELNLSEESSYGHYGEDPILDASGLEELAAWSGMARLRSLTLSGNDVGRAGVRALLASRHAAGLKVLALRGNGLNSGVAQAFAAATAGPRLDVLDLGENFLGKRGATALARADCLRELKVLALDRCEMQQGSVRALAGAPFLASLRRLAVGYNWFGPEGLSDLLERKPPHLHTLLLNDNNLGDQGAAHMAESPTSDALLEVDLAQNELTALAARALGRSKYLSNLLVLRLAGNRIGKRAMAVLSRSPLGKRLAVLEQVDQWDEGGWRRGDIPF